MTTSISAVNAGSSAASEVLSKKSSLSNDTTAKLEALGITVTEGMTESEAKAKIAAKEAENNAQNQGNQQGNSSESEILSDAKSLASAVGVSVSSDATVDETTSDTSNETELDSNDEIDSDTEIKPTPDDDDTPMADMDDNDDGNNDEELEVDANGFKYGLLPDKTWAVSAGEGFNGGVLVIPSTYQGRQVTAISDNGFNNQTMAELLTSITIPEGIKKIGNNAFAGTTFQ